MDPTLSFFFPSTCHQHHHLATINESTTSPKLENAEKGIQEPPKPEVCVPSLFCMASESM